MRLRTSRSLTIAALLLAGCSGDAGSTPGGQGGSKTTATPGGKSRKGSSEPAPDGKPYSGHDAVWLEQGWTNDERQDFYFTAQGSELLPYDWFLVLEMPQSAKPFRSDEHMAALGYITQRPDPTWNPDGLPIGFVKNDRPLTTGVKRAFLGQGYDLNKYPGTNKWLGFTCAGCHTNDLTYGGKTIRIDGGPALADHQQFLASLAGALRATADDEAKFARFQGRLGAGGEDLSALRDELRAYTVVVETLVARNKSDQPYGFARLDAFGAILNQICEAGLGIPENRKPADAPVSYPFLWDAPQLDWVQWNSAVAVPISRNVGEVLGVYAHSQLTGTPATGQFTSSVDLDKLARLEASLSRLTAPAWPEAILGPINRPLAEKGKSLFADNCVHCHGLRDEAGRFPMTDPMDNKWGKTFIRTTAVPLATIGTDPKLIINFTSRVAKPGDLAPYLQDTLAALKQQAVAAGRPEPDFTSGVPAAFLLTAAVKGVVDRELASRQGVTDEMKLGLMGYRDPAVRPPLNGAGYKARPLDGIWATAPYLHSGAVPNLYQLLLPEAQRVKSFHVGTREFDPKSVGYKTEQTPGAFLFRVETEAGQPIPGNSNKGHSGPRCTQAKRADGSYSDFTEDERWALVEYLKTLK